MPSKVKEVAQGIPKGHDDMQQQEQLKGGKGKKVSITKIAFLDSNGLSDKIHKRPLRGITERCRFRCDRSSTVKSAEFQIAHI
jgi:hypothetical protein